MDNEGRTQGGVRRAIFMPGASDLENEDTYLSWLGDSIVVRGESTGNEIADAITSAASSVSSIVKLSVRKTAQEQALQLATYLARKRVAMPRVRPPAPVSPTDAVKTKL